MNNRKRKNGVVLSTKMEKTVTVRVSRRVKHPRYGKVITMWKKYYAHTDSPLEVGQEVEIEETRPMSKLKRWRVVV